MNIGTNWIGQGLVALTLTVALAGCGGSSDAGSSTASGAANGSPVASASPSVSGTPAGSVAANNHYRFRPTVTNPGNAPLSFSIRNKPAWASFGLTTGELAGTPNAPDAGMYDGIVISASDGTTSTELPAFSIHVVAAGSGSSTPNASASGSMIPSGTVLVDSAGNSWTLAGGIALENGTATPSGAVSLLLYYNGVIYQENASCNWWSWTAGAWLATTQPAATGIPACHAAASNAPASSSSSGGSSSSSSSSSGAVSGSSGASPGSSSSSGAGAVPAQAAAAGYNTLTFGPDMAVSSYKWYPFNFYGSGAQLAGAYSRNSDGSLFISGIENNTFGSTVSTAMQSNTSKGWTGTAFGGGAYFEAVLSFTGQGNGPYLNGGPAFWALDVEHTSQGPYSVDWPGVPKDSAGHPYDDFFEVDFMEYDVKEFAFQNGIGNWYGYPPTKSTSNPHQEVGGAAGSVMVPTGTDFSKYHKYGCLWVPATPSTQGYLKFYFDGVQTGPAFYWNYNDPANPYQPVPVNNATAMSGMDQRHLFMMLGTGTSQPMTVQSVSVWQASSAKNLTE